VISPKTVIRCMPWWGECGKGRDTLAGWLRSDCCICVIKTKGAERERAHRDNDSHPFLRVAERPRSSAILAMGAALDLIAWQAPTILHL